MFNPFCTPSPGNNHISQQPKIVMLEDQIDSRPEEEERENEQRNLTDNLVDKDHLRVR